MYSELWTASRDIFGPAKDVLEYGAAFGYVQGKCNTIRSDSSRFRSLCRIGWRKAVIRSIKLGQLPTLKFSPVSNSMDYKDSDRDNLAA